MSERKKISGPRTRADETDYDGKKGKPEGARGKRQNERDEQGNRNGRRTAKRQALVVNPETDKVEID